MTVIDHTQLLRYLHERGEMSVGERLAVEWKLIASRSNRGEYARLCKMHHALSLHFAPDTAVALPVFRFSWFRIGMFGLIGGAAVAGSLLWMQSSLHARTNTDVPSAKSAPRRCPHCHRAVADCPHCPHVASPRSVSSPAHCAP